MKTLSDAKRKYISCVDEYELACRLIEAGGKLKRPEGATPEQLLSGMDKIDKEIWLRCARAAMNYWSECITNANTTN